MRRLRGVAALFTLLALAFSLAENAYGAVCTEPARDASHAEHSNHDKPAGDPEAPDQMPDCPLSSIPGCATSASMQSAIIIDFVIPQEAVIAVPAAAVVHDRILTSAAFHPPRI